MSDQRLAPGEVLTRLFAAIPTPLVERIDLFEGLTGRVSAADVRSRIDVPMVRNAAMDGYAVRAADVRGASPGAPRRLEVLTYLPAGASTELPDVREGTAVRVATGGPVPPGADAVIRLEDTDRGTTNVTLLNDRDLAGAANVRPAGDDWTRGTVVLRRGEVIDPMRAAQLAAIGERSALVYRRPRVALLASGDELVPVERFNEVLAGGGTRQVASSLDALTELFDECGAILSTRYIVPDDSAALREAMQEIIDDDVHLVLTTGGISVGERDLTRDLITGLGGTVDGWRIAIRPGGPFGFGRIGGARWLGLPGNPVSTIVTFLLFGLPLLRAMQGDAAPHPRRMRVRLDAAVPPTGALTHFLRARLRESEDGVPTAALTGSQGSHRLSSMVDADVLVMIPPSDAPTPAGSLCWALPCSGRARGATTSPL